MLYSLKMNTKAEIPAACEVQMVLWYLNAKNVDINMQIVEMCGEGAMIGRNVQKWFQLFKEGRTTVHDEGNEHLSLVMDDLREKLNAEIREN
jgi:predicted ArsR family transcriptional regulator